MKHELITHLTPTGTPDNIIGYFKMIRQFEKLSKMKEDKTVSDEVFYLYYQEVYRIVNDEKDVSKNGELPPVNYKFIRDDLTTKQINQDKQELIKNYQVQNEARREQLQKDIISSITRNEY